MKAGADVAHRSRRRTAPPPVSPRSRSPTRRGRRAPPTAAGGPYTATATATSGHVFADGTATKAITYSVPSVLDASGTACLRPVPVKQAFTAISGMRDQRIDRPRVCERGVGCDAHRLHPHLGHRRLGPEHRDRDRHRRLHPARRRGRNVDDRPRCLLPSASSRPRATASANAGRMRARTRSATSRSPSTTRIRPRACCSRSSARQSPGRSRPVPPARRRSPSDERQPRLHSARCGPGAPRDPVDRGLRRLHPGRRLARRRPHLHGRRLLLRGWGSERLDLGRSAWRASSTSSPR